MWWNGYPGAASSVRRRSIGCVAAVVLAAALVAGATAGAARAPVRVQAQRNALLGASILADGKGRTLYRFTAEKRRQIRCVGACARTWPPLIVSKGALPRAGAGVAAKRLGAVRRPDGRLQVTYGGFALYRYRGDGPRAVGGQGVGQAWFAVDPAGRLVKAAPASGGAGGDPGSGDPPDDDAPDTPPDDGY
jgi:predicted lipoprotein with Yx(FWY)xxD motif